MIDDAELRELFRIESEEHLQSLDAGLLRLEKNPATQDVLEEVFREAHSLKGAARMLGVSDVEIVAHRLEDVLGSARKGSEKLSTDVINRLYGALDDIRKFVEEAVTGKPQGIDVAKTLAALSGESAGKPVDAPQKKKASEKPARRKPVVAEKPAAAPATAKKKALKQNVKPAAKSVAVKKKKVDVSPEPEMATDNDHVKAQPETVEAATAKPDKYRISTIRVDPKKLDELMTHMGELMVTKSRVVRRITAVGELLAFREAWLKDQDAYDLQTDATRDTGGGNASGGRLTPRKRLDQLGVYLDEMRNLFYEDNSRLDHVTDKLEDGIHSIRMLPFSTIFSLFPRMVRDIAQQESKQVDLIFEGEGTQADKRILEEMKDPLTHMIRNAINHGIELPDERQRAGKPRAGLIRLKAYQTPNNVVVEVEDDGRGLDAGAIKRAAMKRRLYSEEALAAMTDEQIHNLVFNSGLSTSLLITDISGRGVGLDVVQANVESLKGVMEVKSTQGSGCTLRTRLPITLATIKVLIAAEGGHSYAIPMESVQTTLWLPEHEVFSIEGHGTMVFQDQPVSVVDLSDMLEMESAGDAEEKDKTGQKAKSKARPCIVLDVGGKLLGIMVDELLDEQEVVMKPQCALLKRVRNVSSATILGNGDVCMLLNPGDIMKSAHHTHRSATVASEVTEGLEDVMHDILLVEDSITTRTQEKRILETAGYKVTTAVDGVDAWNKLNSQGFDAVVSDIQMPNMDGLTLTEKIRKSGKFKSMPVVLVSMLSSDEDKKRGMEVGADAYIMKPAFDQAMLLDVLARLI